MAKNNNGPVIGLSLFALLTVAMTVVWYMTHADNQTVRGQLVSQTKKAEALEGKLSDHIAQLNLLKQLLGKSGDTETGHGDPTEGTVIGDVNRLLAEHAPDGTPAPEDVTSAIRATSVESRQHQFNAEERQRQLDQKIRNLDDMVVSKDGEILTHKQALEQAEQRLVEKERIHSEEMNNLQNEFDTLLAEKSRIEEEAALLQVNMERQVEDLQEDVNLKRKAIIEMRRRLREQEDPQFAHADGTITTVDHNSGFCSISVGSADGLRTGVTFSVYQQKNSGVGRNDTGDIKGKIEVVRIIGAHQAQARIVGSEPGHPIAKGDPVYSPIFQAGQTMEIAVAGNLSVDGVTDEEFRRLVNAAGARVVVAVDGDGQFVDSRGNVIDDADEAASRISVRTRLLVIADQGSDDPSEGFAKTVEQIRQNTNILKRRALNLGIYEVGLSTYLEHIGYSRKQLSWKPESPHGFPARLANGARSQSARASFGGRESNNVISGKYSGRQKRTTVSAGTTSGVYQSN